MGKFDDLAYKILKEKDVSIGNKYYVYEVMVSGMHSEVVQVEHQYKLTAANIEEAQQKALDNYKQQSIDGFEDPEFVEIEPAVTDKIAKVITGEESMIIVSVQPLSEEQIDDVVYGEE